MDPYPDTCQSGSWSVFQIRMFLALLDPDPLDRGSDPDPSIIKQK